MVRKNYLITGGLGLIGSTLVKHLHGNLTIISRSAKNQERIKGIKATLKIKTLKEITLDDLKGIDVIYHCASTVDNYNVLTDPYIDVETNINGTIHILELLKNLSKKPKIIYLSTFFVYGNTYDKTKTPITEVSPTDPLAIYPATKLCTENIIKLYSKLYKIPHLICRLTNVYGDQEDYTNKKKGAFNYLIMKAVKGESINIYKGGNFVRDYIYVDDVVSALRKLENKKNTSYLIGYGKSVKFGDLINYVLKLTDHRSKIIKIDPPQFHKIVGINNFIADTSKLKATGWKPHISPYEGVKRIIGRYQTL